MTMRGKNINLYLMDGTASGRIKSVLANWTGVAYKIPRTELDKCKNREDLKQSGVYFLFGSSDQTGKNEVYVGQAGSRRNGEGILNRLFEHKRDATKDYWTEAIVFITSNNSFGPTEISYLENRFYNKAIKADRYLVKNSNNPTLGNITEEKESELEEFIDYATIIMGALGHKVFEPLAEESQSIDLEAESKPIAILYMKRKSNKSGRVITASGGQTSEGFVILKGSAIEMILSEIAPISIIEHRKNADISEDGILLENILTSSPSFAASFVIGGAANGLASWETKDGVSLKDLENKV